MYCRFLLGYRHVLEDDSSSLAVVLRPIACLLLSLRTVVFKMTLLKDFMSKSFATAVILMVYLSFEIAAAPLDESSKNLGTPR